VYKDSIVLAMAIVTRYSAIPQPSSYTSDITPSLEHLFLSRHFHFS